MRASENKWCAVYAQHERVGQHFLDLQGVIHGPCLDRLGRYS